MLWNCGLWTVHPANGLHGLLVHLCVLESRSRSMVRSCLQSRWPSPSALRIRESWQSARCLQLDKHQQTVHDLVSMGIFLVPGTLWHLLSAASGSSPERTLVWTNYCRPSTGWMSVHWTRLVDNWHCVEISSRWSFFMRRYPA